MRFEGPIKHSERDAQLLWFAKIGMVIGDENPRQTFPTNKDRGTNVSKLFKPSYVCYTWFLSAKDSNGEIVQIPLVTRTLGTRTIGKVQVKFLAGLTGSKDKLRHHGGQPKRAETKGWFDWVKRFAGKRDQLTEEEKEKLVDEAEDIPELGYDESEDKAGEFIRRTALMEALEEFSPDKMVARTDREYLPYFDNHWTLTSVRAAAGKIQDYLDMGFLELKANNHLKKLLKSDKVPEAVKYMLEKIRDEKNTGNWYIRPVRGENVLDEDKIGKSWYDILKKVPEQIDPDDDDEDEILDREEEPRRRLLEESDWTTDKVRERFDRYTGKVAHRGGDESLLGDELVASEDICCARIKKYIEYYIEEDDPGFYNDYADEIKRDLDQLSCEEFVRILEKEESGTPPLIIGGITIDQHQQDIVRFLGQEARGDPKDPNNDTSLWGLYQMCVVSQIESKNPRHIIDPSEEAEEYYEDVGMSGEEKAKLRRLMGKDPNWQPEKISQGEVTLQEMSHNEKMREKMWDAMDYYRDKKGLPPINRHLDRGDRGPHGSKQDHDLAVADDETVLWTSEWCPACRELKAWMRDRDIKITMKDPDRVSAPGQVKAVPTLQLGRKFIVGAEKIQKYFEDTGRGGRPVKT